MIVNFLVNSFSGSSKLTYNDEHYEIAVLSVNEILSNVASTAFT